MQELGVVRSYEEFERAVDPGRAPSGERVIVQYGFPGSGSTFVWQVLNEILTGVTKTHNCPPYHPDHQVVATVRDFRDVLCTYLGRADLPPTRASIEFLIKLHADDARSFKDLYRVSEVWGGRDNILWLKYEEFFGNFAWLFQQLEGFFDMRLDAGLKSRLQARYSLEANLERTRQADALCKQEGARGWLDKGWAAYTVDGINGNHITGNGAIGKWRQIIPADLHDYVTELLQEPLTRYGYV
jgi:hypothetical protein